MTSTHLEAELAALEAGVIALAARATACDDGLAEVDFVVVNQPAQAASAALADAQHDAHADAWMDAVDLKAPRGYRAAA